MRTFFTKIGHPAAEYLHTYVVQFMSLKWVSNVYNLDCGVFLMKHMELFSGYTFDCKGLMGVSVLFVWLFFLT